MTWSKSLSNLRFSKPLAKVVFNLLKNSRIKRFDKLWTFDPPVCAAPTDVLNSTRSGFVGWSKLVIPLNPRIHPVNDVVGLRDLYVKFDMSNTTINMVQDLISSGENTSGSRFPHIHSYYTPTFTRKSNSPVSTAASILPSTATSTGTSTSSSGTYTATSASSTTTNTPTPSSSGGGGSSSGGGY